MKWKLKNALRLLDSAAKKMEDWIIEEDYDLED